MKTTTDLNNRRLLDRATSLIQSMHDTGELSGECDFCEKGRRHGIGWDHSTACKARALSSVLNRIRDNK